MERKKAVAFLSVVGAVVVLASYSPRVDAQRSGSATTVNWPLHNLDLAGSRFSTLDQINTKNVKALTPRWLFQYGIIDGVSNQTTPVIVDGVMYVTDPRGSVYAVNAADGHLLWSFDVTNLIGGGRREGYIFRNRGAAYADGVVYTAAGSFLFALDAKTGKPMPGFGNNGQASVILDVVKQRVPGGGDCHQPGVLVHHRATGLQRRHLHRQHPEREPHPGRACAGGQRRHGQGPVALQHHSAGRKGSGLGYRRSDLGGW